MVRCRVCGFIMEEGKLGDRCPACGAAKTSFEPYKDPVAPSRRNYLKLDLHPIAVHFTTTFAVAVLVFTIASLLFSGQAQSMIIDAAKISAFLLPILVIAAGALGYVDGKYRFRRMGNSQILRRKILYAAILLPVSIVEALIIWLNGFESTGISSIAIVLGFITIFLVYLLGALGFSISLRDAALPGQ